MNTNIQTMTDAEFEAHQQERERQYWADEDARYAAAEYEMARQQSQNDDAESDYDGDD